MTTEAEELIGRVLAGTVEELDIPIPLLRLLNELYRDVGDWLDTNLEAGVWRSFLRDHGDLAPSLVLHPVTSSISMP